MEEFGKLEERVVLVGVQTDDQLQVALYLSSGCCA